MPMISSTTFAAKRAAAKAVMLADLTKHFELRDSTSTPAWVMKFADIVDAYVDSTLADVFQGIDATHASHSHMTPGGLSPAPTSPPIA